jgi:hypothetical protein
MAEELLLILCSQGLATSIGRQHEIRVDPHEALLAEHLRDDPSNRPTGQRPIVRGPSDARRRRRIGWRAAPAPGG